MTRDVEPLTSTPLHYFKVKVDQDPPMTPRPEADHDLGWASFSPVRSTHAVWKSPLDLEGWTETDL